MKKLLFVVVFLSSLAGLAQRPGQQLPGPGTTAPGSTTGTSGPVSWNSVQLKPSVFPTTIDLVAGADTALAARARVEVLNAIIAQVTSLSANVALKNGNVTITAPWNFEQQPQINGAGILSGIAGDATKYRKGDGSLGTFLSDLRAGLSASGNGLAYNSGTGAFSLSFDSSPTSGSNNLLRSSAVFNALAAKLNSNAISSFWLGVLDDLNSAQGRASLGIGTLGELNKALGLSDTTNDYTGFTAQMVADLIRRWPVDGKIAIDNQSIVGNPNNINDAMRVDPPWVRGLFDVTGDGTYDPQTGEIHVNTQPPAADYPWEIKRDQALGGKSVSESLPHTQIGNTNITMEHGKLYISLHYAHKTEQIAGLGFFPGSSPITFQVNPGDANQVALAEVNGTTATVIARSDTSAAIWKPADLEKKTVNFTAPVTVTAGKVYAAIYLHCTSTGTGVATLRKPADGSTQIGKVGAAGSPAIFSTWLLSGSPKVIPSTFSLTTTNNANGLQATQFKIYSSLERP